MTTQPEPLRLAESISQMDTFTEHQRGEILKAAAELRRLHEENEKLRNAANRGGHMAVAWDEIKRLHALNQELLEALKRRANPARRAITTATKAEPAPHDTTEVRT